MTVRFLFALLPALVGLLSSPALAQRAVVMGTLRDATTGEALPFVTVLLRRAGGADSTLVKGAPTTAEGRFRLEGIGPGAYTLRASVVGYRPLRRALTVADTDLDLGALRLTSVARQLGAVTVTGEKAVVQDDLNKRVINVSKDLTAVAGSAVDVLQNVPSVVVDQNGQLSLRGAENVTVLVDGKPSGLAGTTGALAQIPASRIDRIEIVTNPSARYDADGAGGIINIILKKETTGGLNGLAAGNVGTREKYNGTLSGNYRQGAWNTFASYDYRRERRWGERDFQQRTRFGESGTQGLLIDQHTDEVSRQAFHTMRAGLDYAPSERFTLTLTVAPRFGRTPEAQQVRSTRDSVRTGADAGAFTRTNDTESTSRAADFSLDFRRSFAPTPRPAPPPTDSSARRSRSQPDPATAETKSAGRTDRGTPEALNRAKPRSGSNDRELSGSVIFTPSRAASTLTARTDSATYRAAVAPGLLQQQQVTKLQQASARLDYLVPTGKLGRIEAGLKSTLRAFDLNNQTASTDPATRELTPNPLFSNRFQYTERIQAGYATVQRTLGTTGWNAQAGLRSEYTAIEGRQLNTGQTFRRGYLNFFPSATLARELTAAHRVQVSYSRRINRPDVQSLNPFTDLTDPINIRTGNPGLRPEYLTALEAGHQWFRGRATISTTLFYRRAVNQVQRFRRVDSLSISTNSFTNLGNGTTAGAELTLNTPLTAWARVSANGSAFRQTLSGNVPSALSNTRSGWVTTGRVNLTLAPTTKTDVQVSFTYRGPAVWAQGTRQQIVFLEAALSQKVLPNDRGTITARVSDIFDTQQFRIAAQGQNFESSFRFKRETRIAWLGFTYRFGREEQRAGRQRKNKLNDNEGGQTGGGEG